VKILVEGALLIGSIMTLGFKLSGKSMLVGALIAAAILESVQFVPQTMMKRETSLRLRISCLKSWPLNRAREDCLPVLICLQ
jgi:hypothetical protein